MATTRKTTTKKTNTRKTTKTAKNKKPETTPKPVEETLKEVIETAENEVLTENKPVEDVDIAEALKDIENPQDVKGDMDETETPTEDKPEENNDETETPADETETQTEDKPEENNDETETPADETETPTEDKPEENNDETETPADETETTVDNNTLEYYKNLILKKVKKYKNEFVAYGLHIDEKDVEDIQSLGNKIARFHIGTFGSQSLLHSIQKYLDKVEKTKSEDTENDQE